jgi:hypothetical protein
VAPFASSGRLDAACRKRDTRNFDQPAASRLSSPRSRWCSSFSASPVVDLALEHEGGYGSAAPHGLSVRETDASANLAHAVSNYV